MPQIFINHTDRTQLYIWQISESVEQLKKMFPKEKTLGEAKMVSVSHKLQYWAKQIILHRYNLAEQLVYLSSGKPVCKNGKFISISHSGEYVVVAVSDEPLGVDIERKNPKLQRIATRFRHIDDVVPHVEDSLTQLQFLWTAKESIYKLAGIIGLSFKQDIRLMKFSPDNTRATALLKKQEAVDLFYYKLDPEYLLSVSFYAEK